MCIRDSLETIYTELTKNFHLINTVIDNMVTSCVQEKHSYPSFCNQTPEVRESAKYRDNICITTLPMSIF